MSFSHLNNKGMGHHPYHPAKLPVQQEGWLDWTYKGVDHSFPGNGGLECRDFLSLPQRYWESGAASVVAILALMLSYPRLRLPPKSGPCGPSNEPVGKRILLLLMCLTFGIELGFKFATRQMIWIGNPCHLATMMQVGGAHVIITSMSSASHDFRL
ncbi:transmembrane protein 164 [Elysia marginata]|uniref:Transmembrane protein 164 n=1 Tax=Elysia marginata TaxID=1093978 RepID=A0AAV4H196_9GAST|nr:transmembrane protein 164 [Elysia marginata]